MTTKGNVEIGLITKVGPDWPSIRCCARTRRGTECQKPPPRGKKRCRLHRGLSPGPRTAEGRARIAEAHYRHGRRSKSLSKCEPRFGKSSMKSKRGCGLTA